VIARTWPTLLVLAVCLGLALANAVAAPGLAVGLVVGSAVVAALSPRARLVACAVALGLAGWLWGTARLEAFDRSVLESELGRGGEVTAVVTGPVRRSPFTLRVPAEVHRFRDRVLRERVLLELPLGRSPPQGAVLNLRATVVAPRGPADGFDERGWLARRGVHVVLEGRGWRIVGHREGIGGLSDRLRAHVARAIAPGLTGERRAVLVGIALGEDEGLSEELRDDFKSSGLYHLLAVSGQNITFLALAMLGLAWLLGIPRLVAEVAALAAIFGYVLAVGWQPSVVRAGVAGALASLTWLLSRPRDRWHFLALGAAVLLAWTPASLLEPGFQLSFAAVGAIFVLVPPLLRVLEGYPLPLSVREALALSIACGVATAPILWLQFERVPVYSLVANVLVSSVMGPLLGLALVGALVEPLLPSAALALAWLNGWLAAYVAACARVVGGLPFAQVSSGRALLALLGVPVAVLLLRRLPAWRRRAAIGCAAATLPALLLWQLWPTPTLPPPTGFRMTVLDVGQGDAILLEVPGGAVLVDQGPPEADVAQQLEHLGVRRLSALVLTHPHRDHVGGTAGVLRRLDVGEVLDPRLAVSGLEEREALAAAAARDVEVVEARAGDAFRIGRLRLRVLSPAGAGVPSDDPNRRSVVLLASYGDVDALLPGDAETDVTAPLLSRHVEILKVAHHGSRDEALEAELRELRPAVAVISCGRDNDYGHPNAATVAALDHSPGLSLFRTDEDGRVVIESDGERLSVRTER
jgi:competence protein ComEC